MEETGKNKNYSIGYVGLKNESYCYFKSKTN